MPGQTPTSNVQTSPIQPGTLRLNPKDNQQYAWIPPGVFTMGCSPDDECGDDEKPAHQVTISRGFWLGQTEVTVAAYKRFSAAESAAMPPEPRFNNRAMNAGWRSEQQPIVDITWDQARDFCVWEGGRLPTEAEWEYAARAGTKGPRYGEVDDIAWHAGNSGDHLIDSDSIVKANGAGYSDMFFRNGNTIKSVGQKAPNPWKLFDMLGNVWEWTNDGYDKNYYRFSPSIDPQGPSIGALRVTRGGAWFYPAMIARASTRHASELQGQGPIVGFRCVWGRHEAAKNGAQAAELTTPDKVGGEQQTGNSDAAADAIVRGVDSFMCGRWRQERSLWRDVGQSGPGGSPLCRLGRVPTSDG